MNLDYPCRYCGACAGSQLVKTTSSAGDQFYLAHCTNCSVHYLCPPPTDAQLDEAYSRAYYGKGDGKFPGVVEGIIDYFRSSRARKVARLVSAPAKVLDVGCGNGKFLGYLIDRGFDAYGVELEGEAARRAEKVSGLQLSIGPLVNHDLLSRSFSFISLWHVIEHLSQPRESLDMIARLVAPGGYVAISLPNISSFQFALFGGEWFHMDPPRHLLFFNREVLLREMCERGFSLHSEKHFTFEYDPFGYQQSILNKLISRREVLYEIMKGDFDIAKQHSWISLAGQFLFFIATLPFFTIVSFFESFLKRGATMELWFRKESDSPDQK